MSREIKFRVFTDGIMYKSFTLLQGLNDKYIPYLGQYPDDTVFVQFSGLKDKNEKEIFEADILSDKWKVEVYINNEGTFMVKFHNNPKMNKPKSLYKYLKSRELAGTSEIDCVIIGNTYKNPELIK